MWSFPWDLVVMCSFKGGLMLCDLNTLAVLSPKAGTTFFLCNLPWAIMLTSRDTHGAEVKSKKNGISTALFAFTAGNLLITGRTGTLKKGIYRTFHAVAPHKTIDLLVASFRYYKRRQQDHAHSEKCPDRWGARQHRRHSAR